MNDSLSPSFVQLEQEGEPSQGEEYRPPHGTLQAILHSARTILKTVYEFEWCNHQMTSWCLERQRQEQELSKAAREGAKAADATPKSPAEIAEEEKRKEIHEAETEVEVVERFSQLAVDLEKQGHSPEDAARMAQESYLAFKHRNMDTE